VHSLLSIPLLLMPLAASVYFMFRRLGRTGPYSLLALSLGAGLGIGLASLLYFASLIAGLSTAQMAIVDGGAAIALLFLSRRDQLPGPCINGRARPAAFRLLPFCFYLCLAGSLLSSVYFWQQSPDGGSDARDIWNLRSRALYFSLPEWRAAIVFDAADPGTHPDYPPLVPLFIARCWRWLGSATTVVPASVALLYLLATCGVLLATLWILRSRLQGYLAVLILLSPGIVIESASQYMDVPIGFYALSAVSLLCLSELYSKPRELVILAGVFAGMAACTKNEGLLLLLSIGAARGLALLTAGDRRGKSELVWFGAGLAPAILFLGYFKSILAPPNDLVAGSSTSQMLSRLTTWPRYGTVANAFAQRFWSFGFWWVSPFLALAVYIVLTRGAGKRAPRSAVITSGGAYLLTLVGYFFVYILTPQDLNWHLKWSLSRLFLQLWPLFLLLLFMLARTPEEISADRSAPSSGLALL
jgi:hypothetical protein